MLFRPSKSALLAALLLLSTTPLLAQAWAGKGRLQGTVTDETGKPIEGAKITLRQGNDTVKAENPGPAPISTNSKGKWTILGLGEGTWGVLIEKEGFIPSEGRAKVNEFAPAAPINITLKVLPKEQAAQEKTPSKGSLAIAAINDGNAALTQEKYAEAREAYQKALPLLVGPNQEATPNQVPVLRAIASTYYRESTLAKTKEAKKEKVDQAIATLKQGIEIKPDDAESLQLIVNLLVGAGREAEAQTYMARLPQGAKVDADTLINVGIKYYNEKQIDKALEQFNRVITENPEMAEAYYYRGLVYLNKGKTAEAKADFKKLIEIDPKNKFAKEAQDYLKSL
jgi:tetratricopeptide (TPR) repeat protein